jgi:sugar phosphate isomerase/epimerase
MRGATRMLPRLLQVAEHLRCPLVVLHPPKVTAAETHAWAAYVQVVGRQRRDTPVRISIENPSILRASDSQFVLHDPRRLRDFCERWDVPITFDTSHAGTSPYGFAEVLELLKPKVVNVHLSDLLRRRLAIGWPPLRILLVHHQMPGTGILPLRAFLRRLAEEGFCGTVTLEVSPTALQVWSFSRIRQRLSEAIRFIRGAESVQVDAPAA